MNKSDAAGNLVPDAESETAAPAEFTAALEPFGTGDSRLGKIVSFFHHPPFADPVPLKGMRGQIERQREKERAMLAKVAQLPEEKQAELEQWINAALAAAKNEQLIEALTSVSEESFERIWNNPADAAYDDDV